MQTKKEKFYNMIEENVGAVVMASILIVLTLQVILRFLPWLPPNSWSEELSRYLFVWFVYLTACVAIYHNAHIKIDAALNLFPKKARIYVMVLSNLIFLLYALGITYYGFHYTVDIWRSGQISMGLHIKMAYVYASIPVCHFIMALRLIQLSVKMLRHPDQYLNQGALEI